jgi:kumamolisin
MGFARSQISRIKRPRTDRITTSYTAAQLAVRYGYPKVSSAPNVWVAVGELGGGFLLSDIQNYCQNANPPIPVPPIAELSVRGAVNSYTGDPNGADMEVALDMQNIIGATGGKVGLLMVWSPNDATGIADAMTAAANDGRASAFSWSWGQDEAGWDSASVTATETAAQACVAKNIAVFSASGDDGSADGGSGNNTDYPASSPSVIGCGGTTIGTTESAWSYGGGGQSKLFAQPTWQIVPASISNGRRCVPDMACDADPNSGYSVILGGKAYTIGGTSAVAPMLSAGKALLDAQAGKKLAFTPGVLYQLNDCTDIVSGSNGAFQAGVGYDECTGLGVPNATFWTAALALLSGSPPPPPPPLGAPVITSPLTAGGIVGNLFGYQITATNSPTSYGASGMPVGVTVAPTTGSISGTPTTAGTFPVSISASNQSGTGTATLVLTVAPASVPPPPPPVSAVAIVDADFALFEAIYARNPAVVMLMRVMNAKIDKDLEAKGYHARALDMTGTLNWIAQEMEKALPIVRPVLADAIIEYVNTLGWNPDQVSVVDTLIQEYLGGKSL